MLTFGSLFAGIGGIDLGLERAGMRCAWQVEIDDYATKILEKHWPNVPKYRDVRTVGAHNLTNVDLIAGGFPCQDISNAGKRAGITGERSGLWSEFYRVICELRPRFVLVENVAALLTPVRRAGRIIEPAPIGRVLGQLAACGYDAEWDCIPAAALGAPHLRDRVFIVGHTCSFGWPARGSNHRENDGHISSATSQHSKSLANPSIARSGRLSVQQGQPQQEGIDTQWSSQNVSNTYEFHVQRIFGGVTNPQEWSAKRQGSFRSCVASGGGQWATEPDVGRVAHGISHRVDRLRVLGNAVVPQVAEFVGRLIVNASRRSL
jgi:DNA (cytosine-5)-methyltransferase 1